MKHMRGLVRLLLCLTIVATGSGMALAVSDIKFGISTDGPPVTNTGVLVVDGTKIDSLGGNTTHTIGIQATGVIGNVANTGTLTSQTDAYILGSSSASSYGIQSIGTDGSVFNSGSINVDAHGVYTQAYGISAGTTGNIENSGRITVRAHSGGSTAVGIAAETEGHVINSGTMSITADSDLSATATGVDAGVLGSVSNSGSINVTAHSSEDDAQARGLYVSAPEIDNSGSINVSASAEESAIAHGILSYSSGMSAIMNSGTIAATANGFEAISYGIWTPYSADITNAGRIDADSSGFFAASAGISVGANGMEGAKAYSVEEASDFGLSTISNEGAITAQSLGGYVSQAVGIIASETSDIDNFGTITASASLVDQGCTCRDGPEVVDVRGLAGDDADGLGNIASEGLGRDCSLVGDGAETEIRGFFHRIRFCPFHSVRADGNSRGRGKEARGISVNASRVGDVRAVRRPDAVRYGLKSVGGRRDGPGIHDGRHAAAVREDAVGDGGLFGGCRDVDGSGVVNFWGRDVKSTSLGVIL